MVALFFSPATPPLPPLPPLLPEVTSAALLRPGESLVVSLQGFPYLNNNAAQIHNLGAVNLPFLGPMDAASITPSDLPLHPYRVHRARFSSRR